MINLTTLRLRTSVHQRYYGVKNKPQDGRRYLEHIQPTADRHSRNYLQTSKKKKADNKKRLRDLTRHSTK